MTSLNVEFSLPVAAVVLTGEVVAVEVVEVCGRSSRSSSSRKVDDDDQF